MLSVRHNDYAAVRLVGSDAGHIDLSDAQSIICLTDEGEMMAVEVLDAQDGMVRMPNLPPGRHRIEFHVHWSDHRVETVPSNGMLVISVVPAFGEIYEQPEPEPDLQIAPVPTNPFMRKP